MKTKALICSLLLASMFLVSGCIITPGPFPPDTNAPPVITNTPPIVSVLPANQFVGVNWTDLWIVMDPHTLAHDANKNYENYIGLIIMSDCVEGRMPESGEWTKANWQSKPDEMRKKLREILKNWVEVMAQHNITVNLTLQRECNGGHIAKQVDPFAIRDFNGWMLDWANWLITEKWTIKPHIDPLAEYGVGVRQPVINFLRKLDNTGFICVGSFYKGAAEPGWFEMLSCHIGKGGSPARGKTNIAEPDSPTWVDAAFMKPGGPNLVMIKDDTKRWLKNDNSILIYAYGQPYYPKVTDSVGEAIKEVFGSNKVYGE